MTHRKRLKVVCVGVFCLLAFIVIFPLDICNMLIRKGKKHTKSLAGRVRQYLKHRRCNCIFDAS